MNENFTLEYREFSIDGHWEHENSPKVPGSTVIQALQWYAADDERWRTNIPWRRVPESEIQRRIEEQELETAELQPKESLVKTFVYGFFKTFFREISK